MMNKSKRFILFTCILALLASLWVWRYTTLNTYYDSFGNITKITYQLSEVVPFGDNRVGGFYLSNGYSIRVDGFQIQDYAHYIQTSNFDIERQYAMPEKVALVSITLVNNNSDAEGVMLTELQLHGIDNYVGMDWDLLIAANPILKGNMGISLPHNTEVNLVLPYEVHRSYFSNRTWKNLEDYKWYLKVSTWPTNQEIAMQS